MTKEVTKTVKVPVYIDEPDETLRDIKYRAIYKIMNESRFLGNLAIRYAVAYDGLRDIPTETKKDGSSLHPETAIYQKLKAQCRFLPKASMATLGRRARSLFKASDKEAWAGTKSLPTYRSSFVIFRHTNTKITPIERDGNMQFVIEPDGFAIKWLSDELIKEINGEVLAFDKEQTRLKITSCFSWKDRGAAAVVQRIVDGEYTLSDSQLQSVDKHLVALLSYKHEAIPLPLDTTRVCGIDLGVVVPAVCAVNFGPQRAYLGDGKDVWGVRSKFRAQRRRQQARKGLYTKTKNWQRSEKEDDWIRTYYHSLTRQVIKFCLQNGCGTIHMEDLSSLRERDCESEYRRLLWVPSKFYDLLAHKAKEIGVNIIKICPRNTSKRCCECGHISKANRKDQAHFVCEKCGDPKKAINADYNAAKNIALASGDVITKGYVQDSPEAHAKGEILGKRQQEAKKP